MAVNRACGLLVIWSSKVALVSGNRLFLVVSLPDVCRGKSGANCTSFRFLRLTTSGLMLGVLGVRYHSHVSAPGIIMQGEMHGEFIGRLLFVQAFTSNKFKFQAFDHTVAPENESALGTQDCVSDQIANLLPGIATTRIPLALLLTNSHASN